jgi:hypothetical protein
MLALLRQQRQRRDQNGLDDPAADALSVFDRINLAVWDPNRGLFGTKKEYLLIRRVDVTFRFAEKASNRAPNVLGPAAWITRQEQRREHIAAPYYEQRPREESHVLWLLVSVAYL